jgi:proline iminopeptidase
MHELVAVNGIHLFTRTLGAGPDVIVLHGGPGAHHDYLLPQFDLLARNRRLRYYDQRGGGRSPVERDVPVDWQAHVSDLDALVGQWQAAPATLLGYSWGGLLALLYAVEHPERVERLALVCPAALTAPDRHRAEARFAERARSRALVEERERLQASGLRERDPDAYRQRMFELSVAAYFRDFARVRDLTPFRVTGRTQRAVWDSLAQVDPGDAVARLRVPARVYAGRHDPIPLDGTERTARLLRAELVIFEESGHCPYVEETGRFVRELDAWLPGTS